jgi:predicted dehydrogenase
MTGRSRIAVIGAGAIGARHVQAMADIARPIDLDIVDPLPQARQRAIALLAEAGGLSDGTVREFSGIGDLDAAPDLAIVATASRERPQAVQAIVGRGAQALILEKVLFTRLADYDAIDALFVREGVKGWVNCPLRSYPRAPRLAELIGSAPFSYRVEGQGWGLACNLVHHLDEFASLSGRADISLDTVALDRAIAPARRDDYIEFFGTISGADRAGNRFSAHCGAGPAHGRTVSIESGDKQLTILPQHELVIANGAGARTEPYPMPPQSKMTAVHVEAILAGRDPGLPDYATASLLHRTMLGAFIGHLRRVRQDNGIDECPVT